MTARSVWLFVALFFLALSTALDADDRDPSEPQPPNSDTGATTPSHAPTYAPTDELMAPAAAEPKPVPAAAMDPGVPTEHAPSELKPGVTADGREFVSPDGSRYPLSQILPGQDGGEYRTYLSPGGRTGFVIGPRNEIYQLGDDGSYGVVGPNGTSAVGKVDGKGKATFTDKDSAGFGPDFPGMQRPEKRLDMDRLSYAPLSQPRKPTEPGSPLSPAFSSDGSSLTFNGSQFKRDDAATMATRLADGSLGKSEVFKNGNYAITVFPDEAGGKELSLSKGNGRQGTMSPLGIVSPDGNFTPHKQLESYASGDPGSREYLDGMPAWKPAATPATVNGGLGATSLLSLANEAVTKAAHKAAAAVKELKKGAPAAASIARTFDEDKAAEEIKSYQKTLDNFSDAYSKTRHIPSAQDLASVSYLGKRSDAGVEYTASNNVQFIIDKKGNVRVLTKGDSKKKESADKFYYRN